VQRPHDFFESNLITALLTTKLHVAQSLFLMGTSRLSRLCSPLF
jgi:hypothetical protein